MTAMRWPEEDRQVAFSLHQQSSKSWLGLVGAQNPSLAEEDLEAGTACLDDEEILASSGRMVHGVVHDIRHYMTTILANTEMMDDRRMTRSCRAEAREDIRCAITDICKMLDLALLYAGHRVLAPASVVELDHIIEHAIRMVQCHPDGKHPEINFRRSISYQQCVNPVLISSAVFNLVLNACQATSSTNRRGKVNVSIGRAKGFTRIWVADNGPGIPEAIQQALLEPLRSRRVSGGYGLGVAMARHAAESHGGDLRLEESRLGKTVFCLAIPFPAAMSNRAAQINDVQSASVPKRARIFSRLKKK